MGLLRDPITQRCRERKGGRDPEDCKITGLAHFFYGVIFYILKVVNHLNVPCFQQNSKMLYFHQIDPRGRFIHRVAMSVCMSVFP